MAAPPSSTRAHTTGEITFRERNGPRRECDTPRRPSHSEWMVVGGVERRDHRGVLGNGVPFLHTSHGRNQLSCDSSTPCQLSHFSEVMVTFHSLLEEPEEIKLHQESYVIGSAV